MFDNLSTLEQGGVVAGIGLVGVFVVLVLFFFFIKLMEKIK